MGDPARALAAYQDLLALPENKVGEILGGELSVQPRPATRHANVCSSLGSDLHGAFQRGRGGPGGWWILDEPELHLGADILVPDLAGWRRERLPDYPDSAAFTLAPDWACEVLSPSSARIDRVVKLPIYARERVSHVWLVDPQQKTLEAFRLEGERWALLGAWADQEIVRAEPFDAVPLELGFLWAW